MKEFRPEKNDPEITEETRYLEPYEEVFTTFIIFLNPLSTNDNTHRIAFHL